jgi:hypothetical protein
MAENQYFELVITRQEKNIISDVLAEIHHDILSASNRAKTQYVHDLLQGDANQIEYVLDRIREAPPTLKKDGLSALFD